MNNVVVDYTWVKIDSWHIVAIKGGEFITTTCGRTINVTESDPLEFSASLGAEKSCENCLRIAARRVDGD